MKPKHFVGSVVCYFVVGAVVAMAGVKSGSNVDASLMAGICDILQNTTKWSPDQRKAAQTLFRAYTTMLRPLIASATVYRVLPRPDGKRWDGIQYHDPRSGRGALLVFRPDNAQSAQSVRLRGLEKDMTYRVNSAEGSVANAAFRGEALMTQGLQVALPEKFSSDCVTIERVSVAVNAP